ncbi:hypothetical protein RvVAR031_36180 [Agrobacterium vitis]|nr:hypothetical protein RvVAR031_36180 [Agrobacterium vitis]
MVDFDPMAVGVPHSAKTNAVRAVARVVQHGGEPANVGGAQVEAFNERETGMSDAHGVARDQLRAYIERIERLEEEKKTVGDDIKEVYGEAKGMGFDTKILRKVISLRKKDEQERMEEDLILDTYLHALGMIDHAPGE